jgi:hypothetical protein
MFGVLSLLPWRRHRLCISWAISRRESFAIHRPSRGPRATCNTTVQYSTVCPLQYSKPFGARRHGELDNAGGKTVEIGSPNFSHSVRSGTSLARWNLSRVQDSTERHHQGRAGPLVARTKHGMHLSNAPSNRSSLPKSEGAGVREKPRDRMCTIQ